MQKPTLLILAAGMGSRYGGLKQVDSVGPNEEAIIEYSVYDAIRAGFGKVVFVIRESFKDAFKAKFANKFQDKIEVLYAYQEVNPTIEGIDDVPHREKPWGTGHAVLSAAHLINEPFAVINADDYYGVDAYQTIADFFKNDVAENRYAMVGFVLEKTLSDNGTVNRGICQTDESGYLTDVVERLKIRRESDGQVYFTDEDKQDHPLKNDDIASMNFWGFHANFMQEAHEMFVAFVKANKENITSEFYIPLIVNNLIQANKMDLQVLKSADQWFGVTYQADKPIVVNGLDKLTESGVYPNPLW
jgi:bifunctional N-acetylglucosamine-1-phosphate-uridyltransferase/glucosamine-1-phosphate-acetyltransferase GlmU-like protein